MKRLFLLVLILGLAACAPGVYTFEISHGDGFGIASADRPDRPTPPRTGPPTEPPTIPGPCGSTAICEPTPEPEPPIGRPVPPPAPPEHAHEPPCSTPGGEHVWWCPGPPPGRR